jgi:hypothetical protein
LNHDGKLVIQDFVNPNSHAHSWNDEFSIGFLLNEICVQFGGQFQILQVCDKLMRRQITLNRALILFNKLLRHRSCDRIPQGRTQRRLTYPNSKRTFVSASVLRSLGEVDPKCLSSKDVQCLIGGRFNVQSLLKVDCASSTWKIYEGHSAFKVKFSRNSTQEEKFFHGLEDCPGVLKSKLITNQHGMVITFYPFVEPISFMYFEDLLDFAGQLLAIVEQLKDRSIVHGNIVLGNLFIVDGQVVLGGFEFAQKVINNQVIISPSHPAIAPEFQGKRIKGVIQYSGDSDQITADEYAVGKVLEQLAESFPNAPSPKLQRLITGLLDQNPETRLTARLALLGEAFASDE